jgi:hypothetical protein
MLREAAEELDLSPYTLRKYIADDIEGLKPSKAVMFGKVQVYLYTKDDIEQMRRTLQSRVVVREYHSTGRPAKFSLEERKYRARLFSRRHYWQRMLDKARFLENPKRELIAREEIEAINKELEDGE